MSTFPRPSFRTVTRYIPDRRPVPVDLSDNTNLWGPHPAALDVVHHAEDRLLTRYPTPYAEELRQSLAERFGVPDWSVCTGCGSDDILDAAWRACAEAGGAVSFPEPTFTMVMPFCGINAREAHPIPWSEALDDPRRLLAGDPALIYLCRPNNPTGSHAPEAWIEVLLDAAEARPDGGPIVLVDEAYADFAGESLVAHALERRRLLVTRTLSKAYGLAGMRVGFGVGSREVVDEVEKARGPYKVGHLAAVTAVAAVRDEEGWVPEIVARVTRHRARLETALRDRGIEPLPSRTNFVFIPLTPGTAVDRAGALRDRGVSVRAFTGLADVGDGIRVTVGPWPLMEAFLDALDAT